MDTIIGICICTYKRPEGLKRLLNSLIEKNQQIKFTVIIIDNDEIGSAKYVYDHFKEKIPLIYDIEEKKGLANARNKCITKAREKSLKYIVFLDDDEVIYRNDWLVNLLTTLQKNNASIVTGPILPKYDSSIKSYIKESAYFSPTRYKNNEQLPHTGTGNTLIALEILKDFNPVFCDQFNLSGGEDTYLFKQLGKKGYSVVWSNDAEIIEYIPSERGTLSYIFKRSYYSSVNYSKIESLTTNNNYFYIIRFIKGIVKIIKGVCSALLVFFIGKHKLVHSISLIAKGLGDLAGVIGFKSYLYKTN